MTRRYTLAPGKAAYKGVRKVWQDRLERREIVIILPLSLLKFSEQRHITGGGDEGVTRSRGNLTDLELPNREDPERCGAPVPRRQQIPILPSPLREAPVRRLIRAVSDHRDAGANSPL